MVTGIKAIGNKTSYLAYIREMGLRVFLRKDELIFSNFIFRPTAVL